MDSWTFDTFQPAAVCILMVALLTAAFTIRCWIVDHYTGRTRRERRKAR